MAGHLEPIPIFAIRIYCYCPRQCALTIVDGEWSENAHTVRGSIGHKRVDSGEITTTRGRTTVRSVYLWSETLNLTGKADAIEILPNGEIIPVEYKIGRPHGDAADVQLCTQALCLEEMLGRHLSYGFVWFSALRRRHRVEFTGELRARTLAVIDAVHHLRETRALPDAPADERCRECQLLDRCLPHLVHAPEAITRYLQEEVYRCDS